MSQDEILWKIDRELAVTSPTSEYGKLLHAAAKRIRDLNVEIYKQNCRIEDLTMQLRHEESDYYERH